MILEAYHPVPVRLFSSVDRQITLSFVLDYPTPAVAGRIKTARMAGFLARHHYTGRVPAQVLAERMRANLLTSSPGTVAGKNFSAQTFTWLLQLLNTQLAEFDDAIAAAVAEHPDARIFASFPGVGPLTTAVLLAEIGEDRGRYPRPEVLLAEAGLAPVTRDSGRSRSVRFRYAANTRLRESAMLWAYNSMKESPWAAAAFREARDQRAALPPRPARPVRALDADLAALLDRQRALRPGKARGRRGFERPSLTPPAPYRRRPPPRGSRCCPYSNPRQHPRLTVGVCRTHYADLRIMPMSSLMPLQGWGSALARSA